MDLANGYVFANQNALYFLVETVDPGAPFAQFDIHFWMGNHQYQFSWGPGGGSGYLHDRTAGRAIGQVPYSLFAFGPALEGRIDRRDLEAEGAFRLEAIDVMVGECCDYPAWRSSDRWEPTKTSIANEVDPPRMVSQDRPYVLARLWQLPDPYVADFLAEPPIPDISGIARSESGVVYIKQTRFHSGVSRLDVETGEVTRLLDFPPVDSYLLVQGPGDTVFIGVGNEVWQISPDGSYSVWGQKGDGWPAFYTSDSTMLGRSNDGTRVLELFPDGTSRSIASGFSNLNDILQNDQGEIFVSDNETGTVARIDPDGSVHILATGLVVHDVVDIALEPSGNLLAMTFVNGVFRIDPYSGAVLQRFPGTGGDIIVLGQDQAILAHGSQSQIYRLDLVTGETELIVPNGGLYTWAIDIGPEGDLYICTRSQGDLPAGVIRISDDGRSEVVVDDLPGSCNDIAFDPQGGLYIATRQQETYQIFYLPPGSGDLVEIPGVQPGISSLAFDPASGHLEPIRIILRHGRR